MLLRNQTQPKSKSQVRGQWWVKLKKYKNNFFYYFFLHFFFGGLFSALCHSNFISFRANFIGRGKKKLWNYFYVFFFYLSNFFIKYYLHWENINKRRQKNINNTQNNKPQSQIKAKLFNIQLLLCYSVFTIQFLMNQNFQFQKKKKNNYMLQCFVVVYYLFPCWPALNQTQRKVKDLELVFTC